MSTPTLPPAGHGQAGTPDAGEIVTAFALCCACACPILDRDDAGFVSRRGESLCIACADWLRHGGGCEPPWRTAQAAGAELA